MSTAAISTLRHNIRHAIEKFKIVELEENVFPVFPECKFQDFEYALRRCKRRLSASVAAEFIVQILQDKEIQRRHLENRLLKLQLIHTSLHHRTKTWMCYNLKRALIDDMFQSERKIKRRIIQHQDIDRDTYAVGFTSYDQVSFLTLVERKKLLAKTMTVFAYSDDQPYLFCSSKLVPKNILSAVTYGLGYGTCDVNNVFGHDLKSLIALLRAKQQNAMIAENISKPPDFSKCRPLHRDTGTDFTEDRQRERYAQECFGNDGPKVERFVAKARGKKWHHPSVPPHMINEPIEFEFELRSTDVVTMIKHMVKKRVLPAPLPKYIQNVLVESGKEIKLRER